MRLFFKLLISILVIFSCGLLIFVGIIKSKKTFYHSVNKEEALKNKSFISSYLLYSKNNIVISEGILVYGIKRGVIYDKIEENKMKISIKISKYPNSSIYWEAFYKKNRITIFEERDYLNILNINKNMDSIKIIRNNEEEYWLVEK